MVQLEEEGAVSETRAIVRGPAKADPLKLGHGHASAPPRGLSSEDGKVDEVKVRQFEGEELGEFVLVEGEGTEAVTCRWASDCLHDKELPGTRW
eukprot:3846719-Pleurochrysis_carterae.AAC.1